jgi:hypothetical protein
LVCSLISDFSPRILGPKAIPLYGMVVDFMERQGNPEISLQTAP